MAVNIGPKIGLEGEAEYKKALKDIIQESKTLKAQLDATKTAFDSSTSAQEKNEAIAKKLNEQIDNQKSRISLLEGQLATAKEAYGENSTQALRLEESLAKANTALNKMQAELSEIPSKTDLVSQSFKDAGNKIQTAGDAITNFGKAMTAKVTAPIVAVGAASVKAFNDVDAGADTLVRLTGATGEALSDMESTMKAIATEIPTSFEEAGTAVGQVNTRFGATGEELKELSTQFVQFAKVNETDVSGAVNNVQSAMAAWNIETKDAGSLMDTLTAVSQATGADVNKLADNLGSNVTVLSEMGMSASDAAWFLGSLDKNGVDASAAMTGLKQALKNATADGVTMEDAIANLQDTLSNADSDTEAYAAAMELFGNKAGPQLAAALQDGRLSLDALGTSLTDNLGATEETFNATLDPVDKLQTTLNELKTVGAELASAAFEVLGPALEIITEKVKSVAEWFNGLDDNQKKTIVTIAGVVAAIGPAITIVGGLIGGISGIVTGIGAAIPVITGVVTVLAGPLGVVLAITAAVVALGVVVYKNWDKIKGWTTEKWNKVKSTVTNAWDGIKTNTKNTIDNIKTTVSNGWDNVKSTATSKWDETKAAVTNAWEGIKTGARDSVENIKTNVSNGWDNVKANAETKWNSIKDTISTAWDNAKNTVTNVIDGAKAYGGDFVSNISDGITDKAQSLWDNAKTTFEGVKTKSNDVLGDARSWGSDMIQKITDGFWDKARGLWDGASSIFNGVWTTVSGWVDSIKGLFNFDWELPSIKLPHFSWSWQDIGGIVSIPNISVEWYKKAYNNAVMFNSPTVLPTMGGMKGFGDGAGGEIVIGRNRMLDMMREATTGGDIYVTVNPSPGMDERALADLVADRIADRVNRRRAAFG